MKLWITGVESMGLRFFYLDEAVEIQGIIPRLTHIIHRCHYVIFLSTLIHYLSTALSPKISRTDLLQQSFDFLFEC